jgi:hypothetical protein
MLARVREICLAFPEVTERLSHGVPTWFIRGKMTFVTYWVDGHHDLEFPHLWCAAPPGAQEALVAADPERFFRPPYVGHRGWIGVRMDGRVDMASARSERSEPRSREGKIDWAEIAELCEDAYRTVAPARLIRALDEAGYARRPHP